MARSVMEIKDPGLRNAVWELEQGVKAKAAKKNRRQESRTFRDYCRDNGRPSQAQETARLMRIRQGEPEPEDR